MLKTREAKIQNQRHEENRIQWEDVVEMGEMNLFKNKSIKNSKCIKDLN